jgi:hypothetical protein
MIAGKRGLNSEISFIIGLLHDIYTYKTGIIVFHSHSGAEMVRPAIRDMNIFSDDEKIIILSAIFHHSDKEHVHDKYDELTKDADLLQHYMTDVSLDIEQLSSLKRLEHTINELGISANHAEYSLHPKITETKQERRELLAKVAEELARKEIHGERSVPEFQEIIRYYPEGSAFDELKNAWCGAFVYHCCMKVGFLLPIRPPHTSCRLAGVGGWYEWGKDSNLCFDVGGDSIPERGDIVIYNNIVPKENKPEDSPWHDHIGVVLINEGKQLIVAEGNINNQNISGVTVRQIDDRIGCLIRIPNDYVYDGWKYDYKTGKARIVDYE